MITFNSFNLSRLLSPQVAPVCLGGEPRGSNAFLNFFDHDKQGAGLLRVTGRSRACGHGFLSLSASTKTQSSGQNSHNQNCFYKFQIISPPFAASCSTRSGSYGSNVSLPWFGCMIGKILARTLQLATRNLIGIHASITTGVPSSTRSNSSITSALRILTQPQLWGVPTLSSCLVPWM